MVKIWIVLNVQNRLSFKFIEYFPCIKSSFVRLWMYTKQKSKLISTLCSQASSVIDILPCSREPPTLFNSNTTPQRGIFLCHFYKFRDLWNINFTNSSAKDISKNIFSLNFWDEEFLFLLMHLDRCHYLGCQELFILYNMSFKDMNDNNSPLLPIIF